MSDLMVNALRTLNSLLTAGIAITAFSLLLYVLSFNLRDRVTRSLAIILSCVVVVFIAEALSSVSSTVLGLEFFLRLQWIGIPFLPAAYMQFSDALLSTTGRPSRGRRRLAVRLGYLLSLGFLLLLPGNYLVGTLVPDGSPAPHLQRTALTWVFATYYAIAMVIAWRNFIHAYRRTVTSTSRRRMTYLLVGALAPALGSYPYLLFGSTIAALSPLLFWLAVTLSNLLTSIFLVVMAYSVAFFGVPWPDRVVKRRLFKWLLRGPVTASTVLAITIFTRRLGVAIGFDLTAIMPAIVAGSILILEHSITLASPYWERKLFFGSDRADLDLIQALDERLLTEGDLRQFLEAILAAMCDRLQTSKAFAAVFDTHGIEIYITIGGGHPPEVEELPGNLLQAAAENGTARELFAWGEFWLLPIFSNRENGNKHLLALLGVMRLQDTELDAEQRDALDILSQRAELAINDRFRQQQAFRSLEELSPQMDMIQRLRAASSYDGAQILSAPDPTLQMSRLSPWVKDALTHYWGGPKLTQNPLLNLQIVQQTAYEHEDNPTNALRLILRKAIEDVRPEGERRFTAEWILYNILEMKFMEGRKVREIAMRLALSEADLYRKQRVAIEAVANAILEMEQQARLSMPVAMENTTQIKTSSKRE
jgi:hypothetical protein